LTAIFSFGAIDSFHFRIFCRSYTWCNWLAFQEHCEHVSSSSVSQGAAALMRSPRLLLAKAAVTADMVFVSF
jgi:hypothetical protein